MWRTRSVHISKDGSTWFSVGKVTGATKGVDIDAFGFGTSDFFSFVLPNTMLDFAAVTGAEAARRCDCVRPASHYRAGTPRRSYSSLQRLQRGAFRRGADPLHLT